MLSFSLKTEAIYFMVPHANIKQNKGQRRLSLECYTLQWKIFSFKQEWMAPSAKVPTVNRFRCGWQTETNLKSGIVERWNKWQESDREQDMRRYQWPAHKYATRLFSNSSNCEMFFAVHWKELKKRPKNPRIISQTKSAVTSKIVNSTRISWWVSFWIMPKF